MPQFWAVWAKFVLRMCRKLLFPIFSQKSDTTLGFAIAISYMVKIFWRSVDIYHVTLTSHPLTLNICRVLIVLHTVTICTKFELGQLIRSSLNNVFTANTVRDAATLTFDAMTLNVYRLPCE